MIMLIVWIVLLALALFVLIKSANYFTDSAETIGKYFHMPNFLIGVTIVALGTSLPELAISLIALAKDSAEVVMGNVIGSNIANILLILGIGGIIGKKLIFKSKFHPADRPLFLISAILITFFGWKGIIRPSEAIILFALYIAYIVILIITRTGETSTKAKFEWKHLLILIISGAFIYFSAELSIRAVISLAEIIQFGKEVIAASAIALGTSLPELAVVISAIKKGKPDLALGNVVGSNSFNILVVAGFTGLFREIPVTESITHWAMPIMLLATALTLIIMHKRSLKRWEGIILLLIYIIFILRIFNVF